MCKPYDQVAHNTIMTMYIRTKSMNDKAQTAVLEAGNPRADRLRQTEPTESSPHMYTD